MKQLGTGERGAEPGPGSPREEASGSRLQGGGVGTSRNIHRSGPVVHILTHSPAGQQAATALNAASSEGPLVPWEPPDFSTMQPLKGRCLAERSACALWVGEHSDHHAWLEDPPIQVQEKPQQRPTEPAHPFRSHVITSKTWGSGLLLPLHPPPHPTTPAAEGPPSLPSPSSPLHRAKALPPPRRPVSTRSSGHPGSSERDRTQGGPGKQA